MSKRIFSINLRLFGIVNKLNINADPAQLNAVCYYYQVKNKIDGLEMEIFQRKQLFMLYSHQIFQNKRNIYLYYDRSYVKIIKAVYRVALILSDGQRSNKTFVNIQLGLPTRGYGYQRVRVPALFLT